MRSPAMSSTWFLPLAAARTWSPPIRFRLNKGALYSLLVNTFLSFKLSCALTGSGMSSSMHVPYILQEGQISAPDQTDQLSAAQGTPM